MATILACLGAPQAAAQNETVPCIKPGEFLNIAGTNYRGDTVDVRLFQHVWTVTGDQSDDEAQPSFDEAFQMGVHSLAPDGSFGARVQIPRTKRFNRLPIIRETFAGRGSGGPTFNNRILPINIQLDVRSVTAQVHPGTGAPRIAGGSSTQGKPTITPVVKRGGFVSVHPYGFRNSKLYAHVLRPDRTKLRTVTLQQKSKIFPAYPCGKANESGVSFAGARAGTGFKIIVNTSKRDPRADGGVTLKTTVVR